MDEEEECVLEVYIDDGVEEVLEVTHTEGDDFINEYTIDLDANFDMVDDFIVRFALDCEGNEMFMDDISVTGTLP